MEMSFKQFTYVILCHRYPNQVLELTNRIRRLSPEANVLVRHDQPPGFLDSERVRAAGGDLLVSAIRVRWGEWSMVEATLEALETARSLNNSDWIVVISGQDWPVKALAQWEQSIRRSSADAIVSAQALPVAIRSFRLADDDHIMLRYNYCWQRIPHRLSKCIPTVPKRAAEILWSRTLFHVRTPLRLAVSHGDAQSLWAYRPKDTPFSDAFRCFKGHQWFAVSARAHRHLVAAIEQRPALVKHYSHTIVPDESFIQTIIANDVELDIIDTPISWTKWTKGAMHPDTLTYDDLHTAFSSRSPFVRKVAPELFDDLQRIDELVDRQTVLHG
jgi:hypothetical protein